MYHVRNPRRDRLGVGAYQDAVDRGAAYVEASLVKICSRCDRDLGENVGGRQAVVEYPSANEGDDDVYLTVVCWDCVPDVVDAVRAVVALDDEPGRDTKGETPPETLLFHPARGERCGPSCGCDGLEESESCLAEESCSNCKAPRGLNENPLNPEDLFVDHGGQYAGY